MFALHGYNKPVNTLNIVRVMGVNPYGTEGTRPPNILVGGDSNGNVPPIIRRIRLDYIELKPVTLIELNITVEVVLIILTINFSLTFSVIFELLNNVLDDKLPTYHILHTLCVLLLYFHVFWCYVQFQINLSSTGSGSLGGGIRWVRC
jgi:hypothetical protein